MLMERRIETGMKMAMEERKSFVERFSFFDNSDQTLEVCDTFRMS